VCSWDENLLYAQLSELSDRLAQHLTESGVDTGDMVPMYAEKSAWALVAMMSIFKAGGVYVPVDIGHPLNRLVEIVEQVNAKVLVSSAENLALDGLDRVIHLSPSMKEWLPSKKKIIKDVPPSSAAYIIFTSGSTGKPKGVIIEHAAISSSLMAMGSAVNLTPESRILQFASFSFDMSLMEIFGALVYGGCVCIPSEAQRLNGLADTINQMNVNWTILTPTVAKLIHPAEVPSLNTVLLGGEKITQAIYEAWASSVDLYQVYGPTECCIICTARRMLPATADVANIGYKLNCNFAVVNRDDHDCLLPLGAVGELLVEGPVLAQGYLKDAEKTSQAFVTNPAWASGHQRRFYKTGDLVRFHPDGSLVITGRKDRQVKFHGQRIEPGEIEHQLRQIISELAAGVDMDAAVEIITPVDGGSQQILAAFISIPTMENIAPEFISDARRRLRDKLPAHMVPSVLLPIPKMPSTTSGKLDRAALRKVGSSLSTKQLMGRTEEDTVYREPQTDMERKLRTLWAVVFGTREDTIGADENFLLLGGDSIKAIELVGAARKRKLSLTLNEIFAHPKLSSMALVVKPLNEQPDEAIAKFSLVDDNDGPLETIWDRITGQCNVLKEEVEDFYPCLPLQDDIMRERLVEPRAFIGKYIFAIPSNFDADMFCRAWEETSLANPILRTRIIELDSGRSLQVVLKEKINWLFADNLDQYLESTNSFTMSFGHQLTHYAIVTESETKYFVWVLHHALYDGWSLGKVYGEVYRRYRRDAVAPTRGFNSFVKYVCSRDHNTAEEFWRNQLANLRPATFPALPSGEFQPLYLQHISRATVLPRRSSSQITIPTIIRAAWALALSSFEKSSDVIFGAAVASRTAPIAGIEDIIGPTVVMVPVRVQFHRETLTADFLAEIQGQILAMTPYEYLGLPRIRRLGLDGEQACRFRTYLVVAPFDMSDSFPGLKKVTGRFQQAGPFPLGLHCKMNSEGVLVRAGFDDRVMPRGVVEGVLARFERAIQMLHSQTPGQQLRDICCNLENDNFSS
jgi:amino acid adenylation domain-containing protein